MCGRFTITVAPAEVARVLELAEVPAFRPRYNAAPTQSILAARVDQQGRREAVFLRWGLVPHWADDVAIAHRLINARSETAAVKPSFREALRKRRCVIPADGFFEWQKDGKRRLPFRFRRPDGSLFLLAGLWEQRERPGEEPLETCTILTTEANAVVRPLHDRMPVIVAPESLAAWLKPGVLATTEPFFHPAPDGLLLAERVSERVNSPRLDDPACIEPVP
jgi:putative SOS response-associated peptidase YedK